MYICRQIQILPFTISLSLIICVCVCVFFQPHHCLSFLNCSNCLLGFNANARRHTTSTMPAVNKMVPTTMSSVPCVIARVNTCNASAKRPLTVAESAYNETYAKLPMSSGWQVLRMCCVEFSARLCKRTCNQCWFTDCFVFSSAYVACSFTESLATNSHDAAILE